MTPEQIRELVNKSITSTFTSMGINGQYHSPSLWYIDSGASNHMTSMEGNLSVTHPYTGTGELMVAYGQNLSISGIGSIDIATPQHQYLTLSNV